jgi:predicted patatin/cPLA2 family phospholipase
MLASPTVFEIVMTKRETGQPCYFRPQTEEMFFLQVRASAAVPIVHPMVNIEGTAYMDGALSDPLPLEKALADGSDEVVIVCDRPLADTGRMARAFLRASASRSAKEHARQFQERLARVIRLSDRVHVITPSVTLPHERQFDRNYTSLNRLVDLGISDARAFIESYQK